MKNENKYHFRRYRLSQNHPFLVAIVFEDKIKHKKFISGFNMTHSLTYVESRKNKFIQIKNPNPLDDIDCYVSTDPIKNKPEKYFSKPIRNWILSAEDELKIDKLVKQKFKKTP